MKPQWFPIDQLPYAEMWPEDKLWLPRLLKGEKLKGELLYKDEVGNAETATFSELPTQTFS